MVVPDSVKEKVGELPDISGMSKVRLQKCLLLSKLSEKQNNLLIK